MKSEYKFPLIDIVLYAKHHYIRTDSIWYDMALCLHMNGEGYGPFFGYKENSESSPQQECHRERINICQLIVSRIQKIIKGIDYRMDQIWVNISPQMCWRVGYYTKDNSHLVPGKLRDNLPDYEYWEAVLRTHLSELSSMTANELGYDNWEEFKPSIKELFRLDDDGIYLKTKTD